MHPTRKLLINAEGGRVDAAVLSENSWVSTESIQGSPAENLAPAIRKVLASAAIRPKDINTWIYSGGPGSLLGLRSMAMLLTTWESAHSAPTIQKLRFSGLVWTAREILHNNPGSRFLLISPWRTNAWNVLAVKNGVPTEKDIEVLEGQPSAAEGETVYVLGERLRAKPPLGSVPVSLPDFDSLKHHLDSQNFLTPTRTVDPILSGTTQYKKWTPSLPPQ